MSTKNLIPQSQNLELIHFMSDLDELAELGRVFGFTQVKFDAEEVAAKKKEILIKWGGRVGESTVIEIDSLREVRSWLNKRRVNFADGSIEAIQHSAAILLLNQYFPKDDQL